MSDQADSLHFMLPSHPDAVLSRMNSLREERHFCDITLVLGGPLGATEKPVRFHGHKVTLAAASDFLRDQFLLHDGQAELAVSVVTNVEVGRRLLQSCYTGVIEVPRCELVTYLTAASALRMHSVVEKCVQAISLYFSPTLENMSQGEEIQKTRGNTTFNQKVNTDPQMGKEDCENAACYLKVLEIESNIMAKNNPKPVDLSHDKSELESAANCTTSTIREGLDDEESQLEGLQHKDDGKGELNNKNEAEPEISIHLDTSTQSAVNISCAEDTVDNLLPKSYLCQQCDHIFQHMDKYVQHIQEHHFYHCLVCEKSFPQKTALYRHVRVHTPVKPYRCPLCHSTFLNKASLQYHVNLHIGFKTHKWNYAVKSQTWPKAPPKGHS